MTGVTELVDLPDPQVQPLVHPLDVPEARRAFRAHYLIKTITGPPVAVLAAGVLGLATHTYAGPAIAAGSIILFGALASHHQHEAAWAFIPRRRQNRKRPAPVGWDLAASVVVSALLTLALLLVAHRLGQPDVPVGVRQYTFGMLAGAVLLVVLGALLDLVRVTRRAQALLALPGVAAVVSGTVATGYLLFDTVGDAAATLVRLGVVTMLAVGAAARIVEYLQHRRGRGRST